MDKMVNSPVIEDHQRVLALAGLFEGDFSIDWLEELAGMKASQILLALEEGIKQGWLGKKGPGLFSVLELKQKQVLPTSLTLEERERFHQRAAEILLRELPDGSGKALALVPHLLHIANDEEKCLWLIKAGNVYFKSFHTKKALLCYAKALNDLLPLQGVELDLLFCETAIKYSKICAGSENTSKVRSILQQAILRARRHNRQAHEAILKMHLAKNEWFRSRYRNALKHFEQGWCAVKELNDPRLLSSATNFRPLFFYWQGCFREAVRSYEKSVPDVEKYPQGRFPLYAALMVAYCYAQIGQVTQGIGMMDAIRTYSRERGDRYTAAQAGVTMGATMLDIRRVDDAIQYLEDSIKEANQEQNGWVQISGGLMLSLAYHLKGESKESFAYLDEFIKKSRQVRIIVRPYHYLMELLWGMEQNDFRHASGISLGRELHRMIKAENIFIKGVAYKYLALLQRKEARPHEEVLLSLQSSMRWLEQSGSQIELARSQVEMARELMLLGDEERAKKTIQPASKILSRISELLVPDDLRSLIKDQLLGETLLKEILKLAQEVVSFRDNNRLMQQIISTVNRITGAERSAIFLLETKNPLRLRLKASRNLTPEQISHANFDTSTKMIEEVALSSKARIGGMSSTDGQVLSVEMIRSRICVPMILRDEVMGVLYLDNRLFSSAFKESDLEILAYFASQAAIAMDNARVYEEIRNLNQKLKEEKRYYEEQQLETLHFEEIIGKSPAIRSVLADVNRVAGMDSTVLILGETGVGKELVARAIHRHSPRCNGPFIRVHCSALPESLIPSELFGHEKGAFTGATSRRIGRFELADRGTFFLDEIGDLPLEVQVRLLRVLETKEFERVGGSETLRSEFRLVVATNRDLQEEVNANKFRRDLFYRINVFPIYVAPLRERKEDIPLLCYYFLKIYATKMGKPLESISESEMEKLIQYNWPGNVRELENVIERGTILSSGSFFKVPELNITYPKYSYHNTDSTLEEIERTHILRTLLKTGWRVRGKSGAAEILKIHPNTLNSRMKKLSIRRS